MNLRNRIKAKGLEWSLRAFSAERYKVRRAILTPIIRAKLNKWFKEGDMDGSKPKWKSKAFVSAVLMAIVGGIEPISTALGHPIIVPPWIIQALIGLGIYGIRDAVGKNSELR